MKFSRVLLALVLVMAGSGLAASPAAAATEHKVPKHKVTYDKYSLMLDGRRILVQAAEFHYFRLPSPDLWRDILEKEKAAGFNAISLYFDWAFHSPKPGVYDFTGVRDVDRLLRMADEVGLWTIVRPGPYINAETSGGGFPAWLKTVPGRARSSAPGYTAAYREWLAQINPIIAEHQVTRGGSVLLYNVENEYAVNTDAAYMQDLQDLARAAGIDVPITTNLCCDAADWSSTWASGLGAVQIPGVDDYPQSFDCTNAGKVWGPWGTGITERVREDSPVYAAEYQGGAIDLNNAGYDKCRELTGVDYTRYFPKSNLILSGATALSYYMGYGGTNWGWLAQPNDVYTSYDYGAAITEARQLTDKYQEYKRQGYFLRAAAGSLTKTDVTTAPTAEGLNTAARINPDDQTQFVLVRNEGVDQVSSTLNWGGHALPVTLPGHDAKVLVGGYRMGGQHLVTGTSEIMTHETVAGRDIALLYGRDGTAGTTILRYPARPRVTVLDGKVRTSYDPATGDLRLDYTHQGLARVLVSGGGPRPLLLLLGTDATAAQFWRADTAAGPVLVRGTDLLRSATVSRGVAALRADTAAAGPVEVFADARAISVNGSPVATARRTASGSLLGSLPGPRAVHLPALSGWRQHAEAPEAAPGFDDSRWTVAGKDTSLSLFQPVTLPVLFSDEYGFHTGSVWYRGRFTASGGETAVSLNAITGKRGNYLVWLNGQYLGSAAGGVELDSEEPRNPNPGPGRFTVPAGLLEAGKPAVLSVLVQNMGHNDDWTADDNRFRQPRGLVGGLVEGATAPITWRIQGTGRIDPARGGMNNGGLYGERAGWSLPGFDDRAWARAAATVPAGVTWLRTGFRLDLPKGQDTSVALRFDGPPPAGHRVIFYLNGWQLGQYGADIGPQTDFVLPAGLLREDGRNALAMAVIATGPATVSTPRLVVVGSQRGGVPVRTVPAPERL
ncbi:beta-galactosidase [Paractinoplanes rishiriensis]|uniref:beta-galactosidase n=1 Tax=Paractinoplanes rishiriensis TaxID=1050105 RepID=A0A919K2T8_9ACTN|nr:beta-galactosidase [Actinoplanes rishiriensis]GIE98444.1 beta-galactosidase [Actinoplanes rishiriensis]